MTEFIHSEYQKVYVRDVIRMDLDDFILMMSSTEAGLAYWADGVLFACYAMTESEALAEEEISGTTYMERIIFAKHPAFSKTVKSADNFEIPVVNVNRSATYSKLMTWLRNHPAWND